MGRWDELVWGSYVDCELGAVASRVNPRLHLQVCQKTNSGNAVAQSGHRQENTWPLPCCIVPGTVEQAVNAYRQFVKEWVKAAPASWRSKTRSATHQREAPSVTCAGSFGLTLFPPPFDRERGFLPRDQLVRHLSPDPRRHTRRSAGVSRLSSCESHASSCSRIT
jgi:hypothetical protein